MEYSKKAINIVDKVWGELENNYKGSEITFELLCRYICKYSDTKTCQKQALKYMFNNYEFYNKDYYDYCKSYIKELIEY